MKITRIIGIVALLASLVGQAYAGWTPSEYTITSIDQSSGFLTYTNVPNISYYGTWAVMNPSSGTYHFAGITAALSALGTGDTMNVAIQTGNGAPNWVLADAQSDGNTLGTDGSVGTCSTQTFVSGGTTYYCFPAPWDTKYLADFATFAAKVVTTFSSAKIARVSLNPFNGSTPEVSIDAPSFPSGSLTASQWNSVGYSTTNAKSAFITGFNDLNNDLGASSDGWSIYEAFYPNDGGLAFDTVHGTTAIAAMQTYLQNATPTTITSDNAMDPGNGAWDFGTGVSCGAQEATNYCNGNYACNNMAHNANCLSDLSAMVTGADATNCSMQFLEWFPPDAKCR